MASLVREALAHLVAHVGGGAAMEQALARDGLALERRVSLSRSDASRANFSGQPQLG